MQLSSVLLLILLPLIRAAVIEKAKAQETPKEYYDRIKEIPVDCITQELMDARKRDQNVEEMLRSNPLLRNLAMFSKKTGDEENTQRRYPLKIFPKNLSRNNYKPNDNNFDDDYERINETLFQEVDIADGDLLAQPRTILHVDNVSQVDTARDFAEDEKDLPFAVTESLVKAFESVDSEASVSPRDEQEDADLLSTPPASAETTTQSTEATAPSATWTSHSAVTSSPLSTSIFADIEGVSIVAEEVITTSSSPEKKRDNGSVYGLNKSKFQGYMYLDDRDTSSESRSKRILTEGVVDGNAMVEQDNEGDAQTIIKDELPSREVVAQPRERGGGYVVSGTRYYVDNRVDSDVQGDSDVMKDEYDLRERSMERSEMIKDPRFAVEVELSQMKRRRSRRKFTQKGVKTHDMKASKKKDPLFEPEPKSTSAMTKKGGRVFERRNTNIGGKMVTVELANRHLHGVDLIVWPGSIVHEAMLLGKEYSPTQKGKPQRKKEEVLALDSETRPLTSISTLSNENDIIDVRAHPTNSILSAEGDVQSTNACFFMQADSLLSGVAPIEKGVGLSEVECLTLCARAPSCRSLNYGASISICEVFDQIEEPPAVVKHRLGYTYYTPKHHNLKGCMKDILSSEEDLSPSHDPVIRCDGNGLCSTPNELRIVESRSRTSTLRRLFSSRADCLNNTAVLFVRSADSHCAIPSSPNTVLNVNEDDCLFICLRNKAVDSRPVPCAFAEYDIKHERCILSSEPRREELTSRPETTFYEKICVSDTVSSQCSGAAVERRPNLVIVGFLRDTASTRTPEECIEKCVTAERELGFQCLSAMYYYDETVLNCILNDASAKTNPESTAEEDKSIVDYFGVDDCYGLPEIADTRQKHLKSFPLTVEDDVIGGAQTPGSQVKVLRRTRSSSFQQRR